MGATQVAEVVRLPVDLLDRVGERLTDHCLDIVLTRLRLDLPDTDRLDDEPRLDRRFELPVARTFHAPGNRPAVRSGPGRRAGAPPAATTWSRSTATPLPVRVSQRTRTGDASELDVVRARAARGREPPRHRRRWCR